MELELENVRCFAGKHTIPLKPLTILVGENSSGKSTLLAALSVMCNNGFPLYPEFNESPYSLGNFQTIATHEREGNDSGSRFSLGFKSANGEPRRKVDATYVLHQQRAVLSELFVEKSDASATLRLLIDTNEYEIEITLTPTSDRSGWKFRVPVSLLGSRKPDVLNLLLPGFAGPDSPRIDTPTLLSVINAFSELTLASAVSIAPIRTKPKRTYEQIAEDPSPEGERVPLLLARILGGGADSESEESLLVGLKRFGEESGLFKDVDVRNLGDQPGDPFQLMITVADRPANLLDVGYGVSQALPVVVESILAADGNLLLLQQPEVHLHPRAQAALGSFFVDMVVHHDKRFVLETHSDYIVDRIRMEIANDKLPSEAFLILYLERHGTETTVYPITVDSLGNLIGVPPTYREFFLREEINLLTRGG